MKKVNFDDYADDYDNILKEQLSFFSEDDKYFAQYKVRLVHKYSSTSPKKILEFGCGTGRNLAYFKEMFPSAQIYGADISDKSIAVAKEQNPFAICHCLDDDFMSSSQNFDLIFIAGVFHHIAPPERIGVLDSIKSLLSERGALFIFEHNPYNPITQKMVRECPFDSDASLVSMSKMTGLLQKSGFKSNLRKYTLFVPPTFPRLVKFENFLGWLPLGGQYFIKASK